MLWRYFVRPLLFALPPETAHHVSMALFHAASVGPLRHFISRKYTVADRRLHCSAFGREFSNPVGLAAGFDKQATWFNSLACLGFSHVEIGTITGQGQPGNDKPRLFRLPADRALINRMGFNNLGAEAAAKRLEAAQIETVLGINIGKSRRVAVDKAVADYLHSFRLLYPFAAYFAINVSSPNTPGLRQLQDREPLLELLQQVTAENRHLAAAENESPKPILLKISPDLTTGQLNEIVEIAEETQISGIIATNTTISRDRLRSSSSKIQRAGAGGLSGAPLTEISREVVRHLYRQLDGRLPIIGVGGIMNGHDAWLMIRSGASLIQVYSGFVYGGPSFVKRINQYLLQMLAEHQLDSIQQAVGLDAGRRG